MPSPVAHSLVGAGGFVLLMPPAGLTSFSSILWEKRRELLFFIVMTNLPDLDMAVGFLLYGDVHTFHGLFSHSLFMAVPIALAASFIYPMGNRWRTFLASFSLIVLHDLMDFSASPNLTEPGSGVWLFFPFNKRIASPFPIFLGFKHQTFEQLISLRNLHVIGIELLEFGMLLFFLYMFKRRHAMG